MTKFVAVDGIRGGCGATSVCASLAWALAQRGQKVLALDFSVSNLLRLYFNHSWNDSEGWVLGFIQSGQIAPISYTSKIDYLPFGLLNEEQRLVLEKRLNVQNNESDNNKKNALSLFKNLNHDWVLIDTSSTLLSLKALAYSLADFSISLLNPDPACATLIKQNASQSGRYFLINRFSPTFSLQQDVYRLWRSDLDNLIPVVLHADEAMSESLAVKKTLGEYLPGSMVAHDVDTLSEWCLSLDRGVR
ncbi:cell division protein [Leminorella richardii]|uniref:Cell division protein n=1 Tax=Leminorella richardii TaxID=158841 RepID=A0A2X4XCT3_9GAMM|nr:cellulose biosynthesis protein BcsQ [Leminorella richardii]SQI34404.1 cell division protein [Leminorella richardii]